MQTSTWVKPGIWGAVLGAGAMAIVLFAAGWVVTSGSAEKMAEERAQEALLAALTPICVEQFKESDDLKVNLAALREQSSWQRDEFVRKHGLPIMPGGSEPVRGLADACAGELMKLAEATEAAATQ